MEKAKLLLGGAVLGIALAAIVGFSADWITTAGTRDKQVREAKIAGQAAICATLVRRHRETTGDTTDLSGWDARDRRQELATQFAVVPFGETELDKKVVDACAEALRGMDT